MTTTPILDRVAAAVRVAHHAEPDALLTLAASEAAEQLRKVLPDVPPTVLGSVLMHIGILGGAFLEDAAPHGHDDECTLSRFADMATVAGAQLYGGAL